jgi:hypothetical protein
MKKFFPLCLLLIVALVWTVSIASTFDRTPTANSSKQTVDKSQDLDAVQGDEMTPEKAARIQADKEARHEEILRSLTGESEEISSETSVEYPSDITTNAGGEAAPDYLYGPVTISELSMPGSEFRMRELKDDGVIDANEKAEYEQILAETPVIEIPMPLNIVSESEPNDDCSTADPIACGDTVWCATQTTGQDDHDWFTFTLDATYPSWKVTIETHPTAGACDPPSSDTYLELWTGDCQTLITDDDDGGVGFFSLITINLLPGSYAIHEDNTVWSSDGSYHLSVICEEDTCFGLAPPNDLCTSVTPVALPANTPTVFNGYSNECATMDCALLTYPHVWEAFTTTVVGDLAIEYCGSLYNGGPWGNGYIVLEPDCPCVSNLYFSSYDFGCADGNVRIYWDNLPAGTYYYPVLWDPANNAGGNYTLTMTLTVTGPCDVVCDPNWTYENEPPCDTNYVDSTNSGCNLPLFWSPYTVGDTVCGETGTYAFWDTVDQVWLDYRDTDWYEFTTTSTAEISMTCVAEVPLLIFLMIPGSPDPCVGYSYVYNTGDECDTVTVSLGVQPAGTYWAWIGPSVFTGYPCGSEYWFIVPRGSGHYRDLHRRLARRDQLGSGRPVFH